MTITRVDRIVVLFSLLLLFASYALIWFGSSNDSTRYVVLHVNGEKRYTIDLSVEKIIVVEGNRGPSKLEIHDGKVRFVESPCSSHFCIRSSWLRQTIGLIACLPNGITLNFAKQNKTYDSINF